MEFTERSAMMKQRRLDAARQRGRAMAERRLDGERLRTGPKVTPAASGEPERFVVPTGYRKDEVAAHFEALGYQVETTPGYAIITSRNVERDARGISETPGVRPILTKKDGKG